MPRTLWKGAISFGLVHVPVGLYPAVKAHDMDFAMLDRRDLSPVGYRRYNKETGKEVAWDDVVKGYEYRKGRYVVLSDEDFRRANVQATQTVEIVGFVDAGKIPMIFFDTPYYLAPDRRGEKGYALLRETLAKSGKVGVASVVIRTRQHIAALVPMDSTLVLNTLRYAEELRPASELDLPARLKAAAKAARPSGKELDMAMKLVEDMSVEWDADQFRDTYRNDILKRVKAKVKAGETEVITEPEEQAPAPKGAQVIDLMELLKKSVEDKGAPKQGRARAGHGRRPSRKAAPAARPRARSSEHRHARQ